MHSRVSEAKFTKNRLVVLGYDFLADQIDQQTQSEDEQHKANDYCAHVWDACGNE